VVTVGDALGLVVKRVGNQTGLKTSTLHYHQQIAASLRTTLPLAQPGAAWTTDAVGTWWKRYCDTRSAQRVNAALRMVRMVGEVLVESGLQRDNPCRKLRRGRLPKTRVHGLPSMETMDSMIASVRSQDKRCSEESADMIEFLAWSGMRIAELRELCWEDVGRDWLTVTGGETGTKNMEIRRVPLNGRLRAVLERRRWDGAAGPVFSLVSPRGALNGACERLGLGHMRVHDLRHWFASHAIERGVDVPTVSRWLGHKDGGVLAMQVYGHLRDSHSMESMQKL